MVKHEWVLGNGTIWSCSFSFGGRVLFRIGSGYNMCQVDIILQSEYIHNGHAARTQNSI